MRRNEAGDTPEDMASGPVKQGNCRKAEVRAAQKKPPGMNRVERGLSTTAENHFCGNGGGFGRPTSEGASWLVAFCAGPVFFESLQPNAIPRKAIARQRNKTRFIDVLSKIADGKAAWTTHDAVPV